MKVITQNKKARFEYQIEDTFEAGIVLKGTEIKSIRNGKVNINEAYIDLKNDELYIIGMHVSKYLESSIFNHDEKRDRKLLMHKNEILRLKTRKEKEGYTLIPLKVYFNKALVKVEIAVAKGKKLHDKRQALKEKDEQKRIKENY